jgi:hypothetical protein
MDQNAKNGKIGSIALKGHLYSYLASKELPMAT